MSASALTAVDTSVAVPLLVDSHEDHRRVRSWARGRLLTLGGHALIETYSVLTRLPGDARVAAADAVALIDDNFADWPGAAPDWLSAPHRVLASVGVSGGAAYDGLVALSAHECGMTLATRDARARSTYDAIGVPIELVR